MNCEEMTAHLIDLLQGELPPDELRAARQHLLRCPCCTALSMSFQGVRALVHQSLEVPLSRTERAQLALAVIAAIDEGGSADAPAPPTAPR